MPVMVVVVVPPTAAWLHWEVGGSEGFGWAIGGFRWEHSLVHYLCCQRFSKIGPRREEESPGFRAVDYMSMLLR